MSRISLPLRVPESLKEALESKAAEQQRPLSNLVESILLEWVEKQPDFFLVDGAKVCWTDCNGEENNAVISNPKAISSSGKRQVEIIFTPPIRRDSGTSDIRAQVFPETISKGWK